MASLTSFPYEAIASKRYKSPHKNDLSFAKGDRIRVISLAPKDDEEEEEDDDDEPDQWLVGETLDGSKTGTFPASHVQVAPPAEEKEETPIVAPVSSAATSETKAATDVSKEINEESTVQSQEPVTSEQQSEAETKVSAPVESEEQKITTQPTVKDTSPSNPPAASDATPIAIPAKKEEAPVPTPERKPSSPPLAPKPSGLAARIAAFNKTQEAPPPLPKGKPGAWKRPAPTPGAPKPVLPGAPPAQQQAKPAPISNTSNASVPINSEETTNTDSQNQSHAGFSAADAQSSIKMSLKERMAALQRGEDRSSPDAPASKPLATPKPAPGKIGEDKRNIALAGMGAGSMQAASPSAAPQALEKQVTGDGVDEQAKGEESTNEKVVEPTDATDLAEEQTKDVDAEERVDAGTVEDDGVEQESEKTEEEKESERRAAIAKRMAALGGRRMGGGPAMFGAPAPTQSPVRQSSVEKSSQAKTESTPSPIEEPAATSPAAVEEKVEEQEPVQSGKTLTVPRRTAPPRRKKSSASSIPVPETVTGEKAVAEPTRQDSQASSRSGLGASTAAEIAGVGAVGAGTGTVIVEGTKHMTEEPDAAGTVDEEAPHDEVAELAPSDVTSDFEPSTPISEGQLDENARRLEDFIRTPREDADIKTGAQSEAESVGLEEQEEKGEDLPEREAEDISANAITPTSSALPEAPLSEPPPRPDSTIGRPPSARPPSTRPPIPKTTLPSSETDRVMSPAPTRAPPVPVPSRQASVAEVAKDEPEEEDEEEEEETNALPSQSSGPTTILAAPKPRMAVPQDASDDEEEEAEEEPRETSAIPQSTAPQEAQASAEPEELTEEEEDRQRRARIAARMARMGAQPIMGAPMPFKKPSVPVPKVDTDALDAERGIEPEGEVAAPTSPIRAPSTTRRDSARSIPIATSPPPIPTSPPPIPTKSPPPPGSALEKRMSQISISDDSSLARRASLLSRPPVPSVTHSRDVSREQESTLDDVDQVEESRNLTMTPPPLPTSPPPPRAPPRAPPRQPSIVEDEIVAPVVPAQTVQQQQPPPPSQSSQPVTTAPRSSRDLDLMPSSQWWRHGVPVKLPPTLLRPDANPVVSTQNIGNRHLIRVELIFEDYSSTVVEVHFEDDDSKEEATQLNQHHNFAPPRPTSQQLQTWSQKYGGQVAKQAVASVSSKSILGDGTSKGFISALLASTGSNDILPPVGSSFGSIVLAQAATTPVDVGADEIRTGDIIALHGVDFKGKRGLASYHATFGSAQDPTYACIIESEAKKRKLRCILIAGVEGKKGKGPEEVSLRLDDVKSGLLRVFRLAPRDWLAL